MAGDWIKLQKDTPDKPEVLAIASRMNLDPDAVVGKLVRIWSWFDTHTIDGNALSVTYSLLDRLAGVTGFAEQMAFVGWLIQDGHVLTLPNFNYHNGETAKKRALGKNRQDKHRNNNNSNEESNAPSVTNALPEKKREEKKRNKEREKTTSVVCPPDVEQQIWDDWKQLRKAKNAPVTETVVNSARKEAAKANMAFQDFLAVWCARGSQGLQADWLKPDEKNLSKTGQMNQRVISGLTRGLIGGGNVKLLGN